MFLYLVEEVIRKTELSEYEKRQRLEEEFGDLLFSMINLSRFLNVNAENSLTNATNKFINRCVGIELLARQKGKKQIRCHQRKKMNSGRA